MKRHPKLLKLPKRAINKKGHSTIVEQPLDIERLPTTYTPT